ncbi:YpbS family protein [Mesobacillus maritimus]|uniref:DUF2533 family protein n=1 Tax=Mesobacillus maritimus TaxID=1643336 RepID=UPI00203BC96A|nr:DUF2533 family protein [Mesobacillus maritimus]MCM3584294.1 YpbS family protein [Mesobacillus maritimus]MCM3669289.1 YpbS family protein [Mesobacillus maritimus]
MSVHKDLIKHAANQNQQYQEFMRLDQLREKYIEQAVELCRLGQPFSTDKINAVTNKMNSLTVRMLPKRKNVSVEMVQEYVKSI